jgi:hypothetical protein
MRHLACPGQEEDEAGQREDDTGEAATSWHCASRARLPNTARSLILNMTRKGVWEIQDQSSTMKRVLQLTFCKEDLYIIQYSLHM